jgi:uncharacterized repeat protein (TIGR01451 family)
VLFITGPISPTIEGLCLTGGDASGFRGVSGDNAGGGVYVQGATIAISHCVVFSNTASTVEEVGFGGGLYFADSRVMLEGNQVFDNVASTGLQGLGGGLSFVDSDATLRDNIVQDNVAATVHFGGGGGMYFENSTVVMDGNTIADNLASTAAPGFDGAGGGLVFYYSDVTLSDNEVRGNMASATWSGFCGGLLATESNITLSGSTVSDNIGGTSYWSLGGGLCLENSDAWLSANLVQGNTASLAAGGDGGGLVSDSSHVVLTGNSIISNTATLSPTAAGRGGGLVVVGGSQLTLTNNLLAGNHANSQGSGLWVDGDSSGSVVAARLLHNTIAGNVTSAGSGEGIFVGEYTTLSLTNTIISGHAGVGITVAAGSTATLEATLWHGNGADTGGAGTILTGTINLWGDPAFVNPSAGDYHLGQGSAAIDAGIDAGVSTNIDGDPRPLGLGFDLGADEYTGPALSLHKSAHPNPVETGGVLTYTLRLTNTGALSLTATLTDVLPAHVAPGGTLTWTPPLLAPGDTWAETVVVTVEMGYTGPLTNVVRAATEEGVAGMSTATVTVVDQALAGLAAANDSPTTLGSATTLTATVTAGTHITYTWAFGDGLVGSGPVVTHTYPADGMYTAIVTASNSVSQLTATTSVTITDVPVAGLKAVNDGPTMLGSATTLTATVTAGTHVTYTWAFGDGLFGSGPVVAHIYPTDSIYTAVVTASNPVGWLTATTTVTITPSGFHVYLPLVLKNP